MFAITSSRMFPNDGVLLFDHFLRCLIVVQCSLRFRPRGRFEGLEESSAIFLGQAAMMQFFNSGPTTNDERRNSPRACPSRFWRKRPCLPFERVGERLRGRLLVAREERGRGAELSNSASTASWASAFVIGAR